MQQNRKNINKLLKPVPTPRRPEGLCLPVPKRMYIGSITCCIRVYRNAELGLREERDVLREQHHEALIRQRGEIGSVDNARRQEASRKFVERYRAERLKKNDKVHVNVLESKEVPRYSREQLLKAPPVALPQAEPTRT